MGLLDSIKPQEKKLRPVDLGVDGEGGLTVRWQDGRATKFAPKWLRARCPCAGCVEEWTGKRTTGEAQVEASVRCRGLQQVGNYAVQLEFSDGHNTGIFSWDTLLTLRQEQEAKPG
jgi:DUF971 family protein